METKRGSAMSVILGLIVVVIVIASAVIFGRGGEVKETALTAGKEAADKAAMVAKEAAQNPDAITRKAQDLAMEGKDKVVEKGKELASDAVDEAMEEGKKMIGEAVKETGEKMIDDASGDGVGTYTEYSPEAVATAEGKVVLDFYADWCPSCRALEKNVLSNLENIPSDVTILKVDFDTATDLKKKYGVTQQHTLVQIDASGEQIAKWVGSPTLELLVAKIQ